MITIKNVDLIFETVAKIQPENFQNLLRQLSSSRKNMNHHNRGYLNGSTYHIWQLLLTKPPETGYNGRFELV